jgi:cholesterol oxidase
MGEHFDAIVVGTGFGGAITACRLAEAGARVLVLERGRRWTKETYPRKLGDPWLYHHDHPEKQHGWLDLRLFRGMAVALGAGVGGGSLCYSSVVMEADPDRFAEGWPAEITFQELTPYYQKVSEMLALRRIPAGQRTHRYQLLQRAADRLGYGDRVESVPLAIAFDPDYHYDLPNPLDPKHAKSFVNAQGVPQGTCVHLGNCDIGCDVHAKNTLDLNYIPAAEQRGAAVRTLHRVQYVQPADTGYRVVWDEIRDDRLVPGSAEADKVVLAAGSLGSTEILLRSRDQFRSLPKLSGRLGHQWSANANFLTPALYPKRVDINQGIGPTISAGLNFMDASIRGERFFVEDDGIPNLWLNAVRARVDAGGGALFARLLGNALHRGLDEKSPKDQLMIWLGEGLDAADGRLFLGRRWLKPWEKALKLDWNVGRSKGVIEAILDIHRRLSEVDGGKLQVPLYWRLFRGLVTVHPLGGCGMGQDATQGVVDHRGQVFGYPNLYVADGAILPRPTGRNPSMTIGALAERVADLMVRGES